MAITQLQSTSIADGAITTEKFSGDVSLSIKVSNVAISNSTYTVLDDTAVNVGGGYIVITGAGFQSGAQVLINREEATSVSFVDSTILRAQVPAKAAGTYNLYVVNPDGGTAIRVNGLTYSGIPTWVTASTLDNQAVDVAFNVAFDATGATSYANTTTLPAGTALLSNGYFYGTITGIEEETTYNFTVAAIDDELQDSPRTFQVTVTVAPKYQLWGIGRNSEGQLGINSYGQEYSSPVQVGSLTNWAQISISYSSSMATRNDGTLWTWGTNSYGELGHGDKVVRSSPTQVGSLTNWQDIKIALNTQVAIKTDGTLWVWGRNINGQFGINNRIDGSSPIQVGNDTDWSKFSVGQQSIIAIKTNGALWGWGRNYAGFLGLNNTIYRSSPVQIGTGTDWYKISAGAYHAAAIKTDGTLWTWGFNYQGNLGQNNIIYKSSPVQVGVLTNWSSVECSLYNTGAIKTDGTLWVWGGNSYGQLGLSSGSTLFKSSPTQLGSLTNWSKFASGPLNSGAIKTDGTLWTWGYNSNGELGQNNGSSNSSPVQVGTNTNWYYITTPTVDSYSFMALKVV